jgi:hypothetical protein
MFYNILAVASRKCGFREATYLWYTKASWMGPKGELAMNVNFSITLNKFQL